MRFIFLVIYFISFSAYSQVKFCDLVEKKVVKTINQYLYTQEFDYNPINSVPELGIKENHIFKILNNGEAVGYFALDQSMGQYGNFDYLVLFHY